MFYTHIVTIANLTAAMLLSLPMLSPLNLTVLLLSLSHCHHCLFCLYCCCFTDEVFNKWWHCGLTHHTCCINEGYALLMQSLTSCSSVVILEVLRDSFIVFIFSSVIHETLKWSKNCIDHLLLNWDE